MTRRRAAGCVVALALLSGCTTLPPLEQALPGESITGRLALRVDADGATPARAFSAAFDLRGSSESGVLSLATPLGNTLGQARWRPGRVILATPQGSREYADLETMTRELLGESVPIEAWFDWLRGRPWPGATSVTSTSGFSQLGWAVDVTARGDGTVVATRAAPPPVVTVRIRLDDAG